MRIGPISARKQSNYRNLLIYLILIATSIIIIFPIYWMISTSLKSLDQIKGISTDLVSNRSGMGKLSTSARISTFPPLCQEHNYHRDLLYSRKCIIGFTCWIFFCASPVSRKKCSVYGSTRHYDDAEDCYPYTSISNFR